MISSRVILGASVHLMLINYTIVNKVSSVCRHCNQRHLQLLQISGCSYLITCNESSCGALQIGVKYFGRLDCMQGKLCTGVFTQYGHRVSRVRVSVKIRVRFRFIYVGDPTCSHSLAV